ncbi:PTS system, Fru family, IIC component [Eggerthia catenaformis OT 569 = DSM 20559]|uniref:PTS system, Fru family, IIC component n=1 Tax=Eggerthia catenaformis OT 569 = DSM 20559 TaxID=999415 RepID=M2PL44_9FIRM|nr:fructose-specific PTS transporter subunit EIIC [Eggerthia catenaformis]EMD16289.1 PTS system, Fru family, IIC component [Eggerthia catenaformis OT 569 = DSM 20559]
MKISELLDLRSIELNVSVNTKDEAINKLVDLMCASEKISDKKAYKKGILAREALTSTGIGEGIAIPHAQDASVKKAGLAAMTVPRGVDYDSLDKQPAHLFFMIAAPEDGGSLHLQALAKLSALLMDEDFRKELLNAQTAQEFLSVIDKKEALKDQQENNTNNNQGYKVLAVTACPTGIAHTFMAAENLTKAGAAMGYLLKAETNGSEGIGNALTTEEIAAADGIIIAADKNVEMARFDGKPLLSVSVTEGIRHPEELINKIRNGQAPVYHASHEEKVAVNSSGGARDIYKHLMNGVSHMLPFVVGGGILIALAFLVDSFYYQSIGKAFDGNFGSLHPIANLLKAKIGGVAFSFMLPVLSGFIAMSIADRPGLAVGFVGGSIAASGKSGFLGALAAGFLAGYLVNLLKKVCKNMPHSLEGTKPILIYPVFGVLLIGIAMVYVIEPVVGAINTGLTNGLNSLGNMGILLGLILGGMMSIDMGGPFNKAAYVFGTAQLAAGTQMGYKIMASVMVGGMVAPCAIALATILFKNKFTKEERESGPTNFIMGLAFITEGAIPFAASDPIHVLPACIAGSALSGALSMAFGATLMAPHGGIFVFPVVGNALLYLAALIAGTILAAVLLGLLKKDVSEN